MLWSMGSQRVDTTKQLNNNRVPETSCCPLRKGGVAGALGTADLGMALVLFEKVTINPTTELPELTQDRKIDSWRAQTEP